MLLTTIHYRAVVMEKRIFVNGCPLSLAILLRALGRGPYRILMRGHMTPEFRLFPAIHEPVFNLSGSMMASHSISTMHSLWPRREIWINVLAGRTFLKNLKRSSEHL